MSQKQFNTFYWPFLKKVMDAFIKEGFLLTLFVEGSYNSRLDFIGDFPKGSVHWLFDKTDIFRAKKVLGSEFCIEGNVPSSLLVTGNPHDVKEHCRKLIEVCGQGGGYILGGGRLIVKSQTGELAGDGGNRQRVRRLPQSLNLRRPGFDKNSRPSLKS